jgi:hypothetical protein
MKSIAVVTSSPMFVDGGHLVMARALVQALRDEGHAAELVLTPQILRPPGGVLPPG